MTLAGQALAPTARAAALGPLAGAAGALAVVTVVLVSWSGSGLSAWTVRLAVALAAAGGIFAMDDPAAATLAASPISRGHRRALRGLLAGIAAGAVAGAACLVLAAAGGAPGLDGPRLLLESTGMMAAALAAAVVVGADRGALWFAGSLLGALLVQIAFPRYALFAMDPTARPWDAQWWAWTAILVTSVAVIVAGSLDPVSRTRTLGLRLAQCPTGRVGGARRVRRGPGRSRRRRAGSDWTGRAW